MADEKLKGRRLTDEEFGMVMTKLGDDFNAESGISDIVIMYQNSEGTQPIAIGEEPKNIAHYVMILQHMWNRAMGAVNNDPRLEEMISGMMAQMRKHEVSH